ncbi:hypothetical protein NA57DRAFT_74401 [Rhizodiscina lignyota]|uniref:Shugoshin C-terminal domain-containing protein n=1 Tax=Rhizodiscina lignyota TaxID=1504668 RepID=A0A9P4IK56_9PEZI|nr:hypothetical protein NA57DRAFT_74401 [Rhizodiscina lignyota]
METDKKAATVKRRFIRQNRELAKHNSAQSMRIRTLESETSRLLAENLSLREQVADLQNQLEGRRGRHGPSADIVSSVKDKLEAKMQEFGLLLAELDITARPSTTTARRKTAETSSLVEWRAVASAAAAEAGVDGRLPSIREDKPFPRRTLNAEEIRDIVNASESPDIGPPPVAHFPDEDPIKFDPPSVLQSSSAEDEQIPDALSTSMSVNLETRRKRRDGQPRIDIRRMTVFQSPPTEESADVLSEHAAQGVSQVLPIRAGAKRKLSTREVEEKQDDAVTISKEAFQFSRRVSSARTERQRSDDGEKKQKETIAPALPEKSSSKTSQVTERKVLGSKSVNTDPVNSPKKLPKEKSGEELMDLKKSIAVSALDERRARERKPKAAPESRPQTVVDDVPLPPPHRADIVLDAASLPPETPAALDIFSPPSTESSAPPPRDTPEPNLTYGDAQATSRPGRRARAQVNYAEPSLNTKMRRPGKELVDAVGRGGRPTVIKPERTTKRERQDGDTSIEDWTRLPTESASSKEREGELIGEVNSPLQNKVALSRAQEQHADEEPEPQRMDPRIDLGVLDLTAISGPASITSAMRKRLGRPSQVLPAVISEADVEGMTDEKRDSLAIFDFDESSPQGSQPSSSEKLRNKLDASKARSSRRHSSVPSMLAASDATAANGGATEGLIRSKTMTNLTRPSSRVGTSTSGTAAGESLNVARRERVAARRRSMML